MSLQISLDEGPARDVALTRLGAGPARLWIDGREYVGQLLPVGGGFEIQLDDRTERIWLVVDRDTVFIHAFGRVWQAQVTDPSERSGADAHAADVITAPMPGMVISVAASVGEPVAVGQVLLVIESMKMQSEIVAGRDGVIERVHLRVGDTFDRGAWLVQLQSLEADQGAQP
ncbi:acetyl-CoA carboxylase biotin carboxyl carrier protein subunit [Conexibacter sp. DBS9H8]|uniref:acetyl-CoA carboxylase biotin carboxyl carrier protein subunit n=1 Tax=Conexibacter sp. DBS9H8 TaxID=2937801 RepID=UPI00200BFAA4|nr:acetyl-CoA carboxylase biotin carboxyl carrier protein subunit [Conexibacter sp. DBS9H8]